MKMRALYFVKTNQTLNTKILQNFIEDIQSRYSGFDLLRFVGILAKEYLFLQEDDNLHLCLEKLADLAKDMVMESTYLISCQVEYLFNESISCNRTYRFRFNFIKTLFEKNMYRTSLSYFTIKTPELNTRECHICASQTLLELCYEALSISIDEGQLLKVG